MLLIKTKVKKSRITDAGQGLFTKEYIMKGQPVWKASDIFDTIISPETYEKIQEIDSLYIDTYATVNEDGSRYLDGDNCIYMNHSTSPNIIFFERIAVALRDISEGTELTCDYTTITTPEHFKQLI